MKFTVERIIDGIAVLEKDDLSQLEVDVNLLPSNVKEGNILNFDGKTYCVDVDSEAKVRQRIVEKQRSIFKKH